MEIIFTFQSVQPATTPLLGTKEIRNFPFGEVLCVFSPSLCDLYTCTILNVDKSTNILHNYMDVNVHSAYGISSNLAK